MGVAIGRWRWVAVGLTACLVLAVGIGWAVWPGQPATPPLHLVSGTVQADLLTPDQVSKLARVSVVSGPRSSEPPAAVAASPAKCAVAAGPATQSVYGHSWTAFLSSTDGDAEGTGDYTVNQVIGVFPDAAKAAAAFRTLAGGLTECPDSTTTGQAGRTAKWAYQAYPATEVAVAWSATEAASGGWACYHQARLQGAVLFQVSICEAGDGQPTVTKIADALGRKVSG